MVNQDKVAIFWDFENCCPPSTQGLGYDIVNNIGRMARIFGSVTTFKAYLDISSQPPKSTALRSELQLSGVSVVDCPHNGKKDVVDKMAMVDMFAFAVDNPAPATVILIAADRDYAYALSTLRLRNYKVVLITPCVSTCLEACASFVIDWNVALTKTRTESNTDCVRRPYVDIEASLFDRLSQEVSQFGNNLTVISAPLEAVKPQRINAQDLLRPSVPDNDANVTSESKFALGSLEGMDRCTSGTGDSSVFVTPAPKVAAFSPHSSMSPPSLLHTHNILSEAVSKPSSGPSRPVTENLLSQPDICLKMSGDADAITEHFDSFVPNGGENHEFPKDEPSSPTSTGSPVVKAPPLRTTSNYSSSPHSVPLLNPRPNMSSTTSTLSGTRTISGGTIVSIGDSSRKVELVDTPKSEIGRMAAPLSKSSPPRPAVGADLSTAHCLPKCDHPPADDLVAGGSSSSLCQSSLHGSRNGSSRNITPVLANGDSNTYVPGETSSTSCRNFVSCPKGSSQSMAKRSTHANSVESIPEELVGSDDPSGVSSSDATSNMIHGSPVVQMPTRPSSVMSTNTATGQVNREKIRWQFLPLIQQLVADRRNSVFRSSRSDVAALLQVDKKAFERVGVTKFKGYITHAQRLGLVVLGGAEGDAWVALHPDWLTEVQSSTAMEGDSRAADVNHTKISREIGAGCFQPLVDILVPFHRSGIQRVLRSRVKRMLEPTVYRDAGVPGFKQYIVLAVEVGVVLCDDADSHDWIHLHPAVEMQVDVTYHVSFGASPG